MRDQEMYKEEENLIANQKLKGAMGVAFELFMVVCFVSLLGAGAYVILSADSAEADIPFRIGTTPN